jgi:hypothetical protein
MHGGLRSCPGNCVHLHAYCSAVHQVVLSLGLWPLKAEQTWDELGVFPVSPNCWNADKTHVIGLQSHAIHESFVQVRSMEGYGSMEAGSDLSLFSHNTNVRCLAGLSVPGNLRLSYGYGR